tara:strand:+ start:5291 stop:6124 length:834 start_codon:yes stop_codon:yes gene_type:complete
MNNNAEVASKTSLDFWLSRSWTGYSLVAIGVAFLTLGADSVQQIISGPGSGWLEMLSGIAIFACVGLLAISVVAKLVILALRRNIQIEPRKKHARVAGLLVAIGFAGFMLGVVVPASSIARRAAQEASPNTFQLGDGNLVIDLPGTFQLDPGTSNDQGFVASDPKKGWRVAAYANHSSDLTANTPQDYAVQVRESLLASIAGGRPSEIEPCSIGKVDVLRQTYEYDDSGLKYVNTIDVRKVGDWIVEVRFISAPSRLVSGQSEMAAITQSARLSTND